MRPPLRCSLLTAVLASGLGTAPASAQQHVHEPSAHAGTQSAEIPWLTESEISELRNGEGMGLARPAELNGYPGPKHLLELADSLALDSGQRDAIEEIRARMSEEAVSLGNEILMVETHLGQAFRDGSATEEGVETMTRHEAELRGALRLAHLRAHFEARALLTEEQIRLYNRLRGYELANSGPDPQHSGEFETP